MKDQYQAASPKGRILSGQRQGLRSKRAYVFSLCALAGVLWLSWAAWRAVSADGSLIVSTVVGGSDTSSIDFRNAQGVVLAPGSNTVMYVADTAHHVVRKVDISTPTPTVSIVVGTMDTPSPTNTGVNGDGGAATAATLNSPSDVAVDASGNLYISDTGNNRIRKVEAVAGEITGASSISTIAGTGLAGVLDGAATSARLSQPHGLAIDSSNNIYVADTNNHRIRRISGGNIQTIAGSGIQGSEGDTSLAINSTLSVPLDVAVDAAGNIYIADTGNHRVRVVNASGIINAFAGTGTAGFSGDGAPLDVKLNNPSSVALDSAGHLYIADTSNHRIRLVNGNSLTTVAGSGAQGFDGDGLNPLTRSLNLPYAIAVNQSASEVFFTDAGNYRLREVTGANGLVTVLSNGADGYSGDGDLATNARLRVPSNVALDSAGNLYIADSGNHVIRKVTSSDGKINTIAGTGVAATSATATNGDGGQATLAQFNNPTAIVMDSAGNLYIADTGNHRIRKIDLSNNISTVVGVVDVGGTPTMIGASLDTPRGMAVDATGNVYIADTGNHRIRLLTPSGTVTTVAGTSSPGSTGDGGLATSARLNQPNGVALDSGGNIYIADTNNHRIRKINIADGKISTIVGQGLVRTGYDGEAKLALGSHLNTPTGVAVDAQGNIYINDKGNGRVRKVAVSDSKIYTVAGSGAIGFSGDGGVATDAAFNSLNGIALTSSGNIYIADTGNNRIRLASALPNTAPTLTSPGNKTVNEGDNVSFTLAASDTSGQTLTYSMTGAPAGAALNSATGAFSYTPGFNVVAHSGSGTPAPVVFNVAFKVTDDGSPAMEASQTITITVSDVNRPPAVSAGTIPATLQATSSAGASLALNGLVADPDGDAVTSISWTDTFNAGTSTLATTATTNVTLAFGSHTLTLTATDDRNATASTTATVVVQDTQAPVFANIPADITRTISSGTSTVVTYTMPTATDALDGAVTVTASKASGSSFPVGVTTVTFTATDTHGNTATATFKVTVNSSSGNGAGTTTTYDIAAFAGSGAYGSSGDAGAATAATFRRPQGVAVDAAGNVYIADADARVVRKVNASDGKINTIAGTGAKGFSGDATAATTAKLNNPTGVAVDAAGNIFIADTGNNRIRKINASDGQINTVAGSGASGFSGDNGAATSAKLSAPTAVAVDTAGNIYVADTGNNRVRKINAADGKINTVAGNGASGYDTDNVNATLASLDHPTGLAISSDGSTLYIADTGNNRIRQVSGGIISTAAGDGTAGSAGDSGPALSASLNAPASVVVESDGSLLITDAGNDRIRKVSAADGKMSTVVGTGITGNTGDGGHGVSATLDTPSAIAINASGSLLYFADTGNLRVRKLTTVITGPPNALPLVDSVFNQSLNKNQALNVALSATDADGDNVTFSVVPALSFLSITNADPVGRTATLFIQPNNSNVGTYSVQIKATDSKGGSALTNIFTITVNDPNGGGGGGGGGTNHSPVASAAALSAQLEATGPTGVTVNLNGSASSDVDGDSLTYQWSDNGTAFATTVTASRALSLGSHNITLTVNDGHGGTNSTSQTVLVRDTVAPTISITPNTVTFTQDQAVVLPTPTVSDVVDTAVTVTNDAPQSYPVGTTVVTFTATDHSGNSATATVSVTVNPAGLRVTSISPNSAQQGQTITMTISGSNFVPGVNVTFSGGGVTATVLSVTSTQITARVTVSATAQTATTFLNYRDVTVSVPGQGGATLPRVFSITRKF